MTSPTDAVPEPTPAESSPDSDHPAADARHVSVTRLGQRHYRATSDAGAELEFGSGPGLLSPVELLLAALGGCTAVDVDVVTSRRCEPERFDLDVSARRVTNPGGGVRLDDLEVTFHLQFPATDDGARAGRLVPRLVRLSHDVDCTVSRTLEHSNEVRIRVD